MPLLDHFHGALSRIYSWEAIHSGWAGSIVASLNSLMPPRFTAIERQRFGTEVVIDIATFEDSATTLAEGDDTGGTALLSAPAYAPPAPWQTIPVEFPDVVEVQIYVRDGGIKLVGAIEIVSPANKDRPERRQAFAAKCLSYLKDGVSVMIIDVVTDRTANLHEVLMTMLGAPLNDADDRLYASAYRPFIHGKTASIDVWVQPLAVGQALPVMPLRLTGDLFVPVDLEATYTDCCRIRRLA